MADHSKPTTTSTYSNFVSELDGRFDDLALGLDPATTSPTNVPTNAIRWNSASYKWQKWNGTAWGDLSSRFDININGTVGATTPAAGAFTTISASNDLTLSGGTANGVAYLNGSKVLTTGSALTFDGGKLEVSSSGEQIKLTSSDDFSSTGTGYLRFYDSVGAKGYVGYGGTASRFEINTGASMNLNLNAVGGTMTFQTSNSEQMRLTSTGLGIGTSSPTAKLHVIGTLSTAARFESTSTTGSNGFVTVFHRSSTTAMPLQLVGSVSFTRALTDASIDTPGSIAVWGNNSASSPDGYIISDAIGNHRWRIGGSEQMRLTSTGLGIGTSSPNYSLTSYKGGAVANYLQVVSGATGPGSGNGLLLGVDASGNSVINAQGGGINLYTYVAGLLRTTIDSSGNLGLGVTPSAWQSVRRALQVGTNAALWGQASGAGTLFLSNNTYYDGTNFRYLNTSGASYTAQQTDGSFTWNQATSGTAGNAISFTQAMTLDASGNLALGATSASARLDVVGGSIRVNEDSIGTKIITVRSDYAGLGPAINVTTSHPLLFLTANTERARITSGGDLLVGTTSAITIDGTTVDHAFRGTTGNSAFAVGIQNTGNSTPQGLAIKYTAAAPNGTGSVFLYCSDNLGVNRAEIRSNGGLANYSANNVNLSDRREKTNFAPAKSYLDTICAIPVQTFNYIDQSPDDPGLTLGVVAQDVQAVAPELVMESNWGTEDDPKMRLSIYQTDLQYALMKAIQEQQAIINQINAKLEAQAAEIAALKSK